MSFAVISVHFRRAFFVLFPLYVGCCRWRHLSWADADRARPAAATAGTRAGGRPSVRPVGLMMRRPATRGYSAVSAGSDLSGINRRPGQLTAVASPVDRSSTGPRWTGGRENAPAGCLHMSNQCMTSRREICIHKWSGVILAGPGDDLSYQLPRRRFSSQPSCILDDAFHVDPSPLVSVSPASRVPLGCRRKSVGVCWSRHRQGDTTRPGLTRNACRKM